MICPYCGNHQYESEELSRTQETPVAVACPECHKPAIISWRVEHLCEKVEDAFFGDIPQRFVKEMAEAIEGSY